MSRKLFSVIALVALMLLASGLYAQSNEGRITGRVTDQTGAVLPHAKVTITNTGTGVSRVLATSGSGDYVAPNLEPGAYAVVVEATGFTTMERKDVRLEVATSLRLDFNLKPGKVSEVVVVTGEPPLVDTVSTTLGGTITNVSINELPLQGRDFQNLLALRPGVQRIPGGGFLSVTSNGNRPNENNYMVDGTDDNDIYYGDTVVNGVGVQGTPATHLPLDAIQEFRSEQNQGAEYGWKPGAVVNIGLKSGTNAFHGTAYYFHRNSAFDARNFFNPYPETASALLLHQYGASVGGPIIKEKWFFFANYEGTRDKVGNPGPTSSPVTSTLGGDTTYSLADAWADLGCSTPGNCNPLSMQIANLFLPNPGNPSASDPSLINFDFNNTNRENNFVVKSDFHPNSKNVISGRYIWGMSHQVEEDTVPLRPEWLSFADTRVDIAGATWTSTPANNWVNELRFGYNRDWQYINSLDGTTDPLAAYGVNTGISGPYYGGLPRIDIQPFNYMGGNSSWPLLTTPNHTLQFTDNASWLHGKHNIQFGGEFRHGGTDNYRAQYGRGRIRFRTHSGVSGLENFLLGNVYRAYVLTGDPHRVVTMEGFGGFVRDDWRISKRVTINIGLRYDYTPPIKEAHDQLANFIPSVGLLQVGFGLSSPYNAQKTNFSPRAGFAWDIFGDGKTVLRAGTSLIYEQPTIRTFIDRAGLGMNPTGASGVTMADGVTPATGNINTVSRTAGGGSVNWTLAGPLFNVPSLASCDSSFNGSCNVFGVAQKLATPRVLSWNLNLQQQLTKHMSLQVAYVGSKGISLYSHRDINQVDPNLDDGSEMYGRPYTYNCPLALGGNDRGGPCYPWIQSALYMENFGKSIYHGLQVTLTQKSWHGWDFLAGYTWAHAIDNGSSDRGGYPQDAWNMAQMWGNSDYDIRHRFTFSTTYNVPDFNAPAQLLKGWQVTSIVTAEGGEPFDLYDGSNDISGTYTYGYEHWDFHGNPHDVHAGLTSIPYFDYSPGHTNALCDMYAASATSLHDFGCYVMGSAVITPAAYYTFGNMGRNIFRGPMFVNLDLSVTKRWKFGERVAMQMRGEFFNVLNHPNFDVWTMNTDLSSPSDVGTVRFTPDVGMSNPVIGSGGSRHIQLGLKLIW